MKNETKRNDMKRFSQSNLTNFMSVQQLKKVQHFLFSKTGAFIVIPRLPVGLIFVKQNLLIKQTDISNFHFSTANNNKI